MIGIGLIARVTVSSGNSARAIGIDDHSDAIAPGIDADLVLLDAEADEELVLGPGIAEEVARQELIFILQRPRVHNEAGGVGVVDE